MANFLTITALFSHVALWHGKVIIAQLRAAFKQIETPEDDDIHNQLMRAYEDIPEWAYAIFLATMIVIFIVVTQTTAYKLPIWASFLGVGLTLLCILPIGVVLGATGTPIYLNVLAQFIIGFLLPGDTIGVMTFKSLVTNTGLQAVSLIRDLKLAHYMKISPIYM